MSHNILITGAAGYIGGSLVADFLASNSTVIKGENITAAVRSKEQAAALSKLGVNVLQLDLMNESLVIETLLHHNISIVIHCASSLDSGLALHLITALSHQKQLSGEETYFVHTSALSAFYEKTGWTHEGIKDTTSVFDVEKQLADSFPIRKTDVTIIEHAKASGVTAFIVIPSTVYGKGSGAWNQLSVVLPISLNAFISCKRVYKFAENTKVSGVHISDLTALYKRIIEKILMGETLPSGEEGYYFALAHDIYWWEYLDQLALALNARGLITDSDIPIWPSDKAAAESLGVPEQFVQALWNSGENIISNNTQKVGWHPVWNKDRFLQHVDDEIKAVVELGQAKSSLVGSLFESARG